MGIAMACAGTAGAREYYEIRVYKLKSEEKAAAFDKAASQVFLPMMKKAGLGPVGVFKPKDAGEEGSPVLRYVLTTFPTLEHFESIREMKGLGEGIDFSLAQDYLRVEGKKDAAFERIESSLLVAFKGFPKVKVPEGESDERFFELRVYESPSEVKGMLKVHMFDEGGELPIFEDVGLRGVFFGEARVAANLPQLTYMLVYDNEEEKKKAWDAFRTSPDWNVLKKEERYAGTVSKIHSYDLVALPYSGIK